MMKYCTLSYSQSDNLGDEIQSLAAEQYLPTFDGFVDRDKGLHAVTEPTFIFMNGWFKHGPNHWRNDASHCWPPAPSVHPAFIGFHIAYPDLLADEFVEYYRRWAPIGCRDQGTVDMLREKRIDAHLTRCLTLTFPPREAEPANGGVYIVEGMERIPRETIPPELADGAQYRNHYGRYMDRFSNGDIETKRRLARAMLDEYRSSARLVITNLLHCAMPCMAMQVPVVFIPPDDPNDPTGYRLGPIRDLLRFYKPGDRIDWQPRPPDISAVADEIRDMARQLVI